MATKPIKFLQLHYTMTQFLITSIIGSITSRCSGKEPALIPRTLFSGRNVDQTRESGGNRAYINYRMFEIHSLLPLATWSMAAIMFASHVTTPVKIGFASRFLTLRSPHSPRGLMESLRPEEFLVPVSDWRTKALSARQKLGQGILIWHWMSGCIDYQHFHLKTDILCVFWPGM